MNNTKTIYADAIYLNKNIRVSIAGDGTDYEDLLNFENLLDILQSEITVIELVENEIDIDIDSIENINAYELPENEEDFRQIAEFCRLQYHKNTEIIDALKQLNKEIKSIKEK